ncbi:hypothetical protein BY458DRAFT_512653 [Sporodiniella umbellata]|nr:hypothetical protein BY458DRAFT_512653 [Sporodiniella umbellata]
MYVLNFISKFWALDAKSQHVFFFLAFSLSKLSLALSKRLKSVKPIDQPYRTTDRYVNTNAIFLRLSIKDKRTGAHVVSPKRSPFKSNLGLIRDGVYVADAYIAVAISVNIFT